MIEYYTCISCGYEKAIVIDEYFKDKKYWFMFCDECGLESGYFDEKEKAINSWKINKNEQ